MTLITSTEQLLAVQAYLLALDWRKIHIVQIRMYLLLEKEPVWVLASESLEERRKKRRRRSEGKDESRQATTHC